MMITTSTGPWTEERIAKLLQEAIEEASEELNDNVRVVTFAQAQILTYNQGLVLNIKDSEFQITIVRSQ